MNDYHKRAALELLDLTTSSDGEAAIVNAILHLADVTERASAPREVTDVERALDAVRALHKPQWALLPESRTCAECGTRYPCRTLRTIADHPKEKP